MTASKRHEFYALWILPKLFDPDIYTQPPPLPPTALRFSVWIFATIFNLRHASPHRHPFDHPNKTSVEEHKSHIHSFCCILPHAINYSLRHPVSNWTGTANHWSCSLCLCVQLSCLLQALGAFKKYSPGEGRGGEGRGLKNFTSVQNTGWNYSSVYFNIYVFAICNPAVDYIPSLYSFNVIACPLKGIPEAGGCQLSLSSHCLPSVDKDHAFGVSQKTLYLNIWAKHAVIAHVWNTSCWPVLELEWECLRTRN